MNYHKLIAAISLSLLAATGCKSQNSAVTPSVQAPQGEEQANAAAPAAAPTAPNNDAAIADAAPSNPDAQGEEQANAADPAAEPTAPNDDAAIADAAPANPDTQGGDQANPAKAADVPPDPTGYVDIADWCRPGMTEPISAQEWAKANNAFGLKFLAQTKGNTVFSPYSIERALGMTLDGACATTASELLAALEMPNAMRLSISGRDVDDAMKAVNKDTMLEIENTLWPDKTMTLPADYLARISAGYRNKTIYLDYRNNPEGSRQTINNNIAKATHDRITDLIPGGAIDKYTRLVLTNAVYFKSKWQHQFKEKDTKPDKFYNSNKQIETKTMKQVGGNHTVCIAKDYAIYDLEFDSSIAGDKGAYVMRIILPTIDKANMDKRMDQLKSVEEQLTGDFLAGCKNDRFDNVYVSMPKFRLAPATMSINRMLKDMGVNKALEPFGAEFYAMPNTTPAPSDRTGYLYISDIYHKAFIEIDEKGGEAVAATAVIMGMPKCLGCDGAPKQKDYYFTVDHPFIYMIMEKSTGAAIFMGRVTDL